jgi:hypothetical protein
MVTGRGAKRFKEKLRKRRRYIHTLWDGWFMFTTNASEHTLTHSQLLSHHNPQTRCFHQGTLTETQILIIGCSFYSQTEFVQHSAYKGRSHRRNGATNSHIIDIILLYRSPIPVRRRGSFTCS